MRSRRSYRLGLLVVVLALAAWAVVVAKTILQVDHEARAGLATATAARANLTLSSVLHGGPNGALLRADAQFAEASAQLHKPWIVPLRVLPILGRQLSAASHLADAAHIADHASLVALEQAQTLLARPHGTGQQLVGTLQALGGTIAGASKSLNGIELGPSNALVGPLAHERAKLVSSLDQLRTAVANAGAATRSVSRLLAGPSQYLVLASNNAEARAGSGMFLEAGVMTTNNGTIHIGPLVATADILLPPGAVAAGGDVAARGSFGDPTSDMRSLALDPDFDVTAPLAARMWQAATGQHVDGVLSVDVEALQRLLTATGAVSVGGVTVNADNAVPFLLNGQYSTFDTSAGQVDRREALATIAHGALSAIDGAKLDDLATAFEPATRGRHVMVWSNDAAMESSWTQAGVGGALQKGDLQVSVLNRGGNKLDYFVTSSVSATTSVQGANTDLKLAVTIHNDTPGGQPAYVAGPYPGLGLRYGEYLGILSVVVPGDTVRANFEGSVTLPAAGSEGPNELLAGKIDLPAGATATLTVDVILPGHHGQVTVVPSARIPGINWSYQGTTFLDTKSQSLSY